MFGDSAARTAKHRKPVRFPCPAGLDIVEPHVQIEEEAVSTEAATQMGSKAQGSGIVLGVGTMRPILRLSPTPAPCFPSG